MDTPSGRQDRPGFHILENVPSYSNFLQEHLEANVPCLISPSLISHWPALTRWTKQEDKSQPVTSRPDWEYFREHYGDEIVSVAQCNSRAFSDQEREQRPLRDVIDLWTSGAGNDLYVKDWHLAKSVRNKGEPPFYETPDCFQDDWMNAFWEQEGEDDFRFVYMGVAGTFTPLHRDVYTSYSWSSNIIGTKLWRLFPPSVSHHLRRHPDHTSSEIVFDVRDVNLAIFTGFEEARGKMLLVEQRPGWTIFVPSGWYHQVENVTDCISINHNWCNVNNLPSMYSSLLIAVSDVESALSDVRDLLRTRSGNPEWEREWTAVVQDVLLKDSGWDWKTFWRMIVHNIGQLEDPPRIQNSVWPPTPKALCSPIEQTKAVVGRLLTDFSSARPLDAAYISDLTEILNTLRSLLTSC